MNELTEMKLAMEQFFEKAEQFFDEHKIENLQEVLNHIVVYENNQILGDKIKEKMPNIKLYFYDLVCDNPDDIANGIINLQNKSKKMQFGKWFSSDGTIKLLVVATTKE